MGTCGGLQAGEGYDEIWLLTDSLTNQVRSPAWLGVLPVTTLARTGRYLGPSGCLKDGPTGLLAGRQHPEACTVPDRKPRTRWRPQEWK